MLAPKAVHFIALIVCKYPIHGFCFTALKYSDVLFCAQHSAFQKIYGFVFVFLYSKTECELKFAS